MAVTRITGETWNQDGGGASPITKSHTCATGTTTLVVGFTDPSVGTISAMTYDGVAMTVVQSSSGNRRVVLGVLHNPTVGAARNIEITMGSNATDYAMFADDLSGVDQNVSPITNQSVTNTNPVTVTLNPSGSEGIIYLLIAAAWNGTTGGPGTDQNTIYHIDMGVDTMTATYEIYSVAGANNQTWSFSSIDPGYTAFAAALQAASGFVPKIIMS